MNGAYNGEDIGSVFDLGLVINPFGEAMAISKDILKAMLGACEENGGEA